jgi:hypothetical protein
MNRRFASSRHAPSNAIRCWPAAWFWLPPIRAVAPRPKQRHTVLVALARETRD